MDDFVIFNVFAKYGMGDGDLPGAREFQYALCSNVERELSEKYPGIKLIMVETAHNERPIAIEWEGQRVYLDEGLPGVVEENAPQFARDVVSAYLQRSGIVTEFVDKALALSNLIERARNLGIESE